MTALVVALLAAPNIVFLSVDTLRADHLGCYGYPHDTSPNLDRLAETGLVFDDCVCEVPLTNPSFVSMFTSLHPRTTGAIRNGLPLPDGFPTAIEQLKAAGYYTFCVQSNWTLKKPLSGLARGFDVYDDHFHKKRWGFIKPERYADEVTDVALELLKACDPSRPFFCWIHYSDPHLPYRFHRQFHPMRKPLRAMDKVERARAEYDSEVAFTDHHLGRLLEALPKENTYVVFTADHGESLYEHNYLGHGRRIYQDGLRIPLIISGPGVSAGRTNAPARGMDLAPTLLGLAGLPTAEGMLGIDLLKGQTPAERVRVVETYGGAVPRMPGARALMASRPPMRQGVLLGEWKLILAGKRPELYHLRTDPGEITNVAEKEPGRVAALGKLIQQFDATFPRRVAKEAELGPEDIQALRSLGYLE